MEDAQKGKSKLAELFAPGQKIYELDDDDFNELCELVGRRGCTARMALLALPTTSAMRCFYSTEGCAGPVTPAGGRADSAWLNGAVDRDSGYCMAHRAAGLRDAKWDGVKRVFPDGEGVGGATARARRMVRS